MEAHSTNSPRRLESLLIVSQVAGPLIKELATDLTAAGVRCTVMTGWLDAAEGETPPFDVVRGAALVKAPSWRRMLSWLRFTMQVVWQAIRHRRTPLLVTTNPPWAMLALSALRWLLGARYVLLMYDLYPDVLERMGKCNPRGLVARLWRRASRKALLRAEGVITLGPRITQTLSGHMRPGDRWSPRIIPNWADTDVIRPRERSENPFAREHGLAGKFVVIYSGAFGATHDVDSIVEAAAALSDLSDVHFLLIGGGTRQKEVSDLVARRALANLTLLPLQPLAVLPYSLASADCAIVCLDQGYEGISVPSKTYYALAAGLAILAVSPEGTELTDLIEAEGCGVAIPPHRPDLLGAAVRRLHADRSQLARFQQASRAAAVSRYSRSILTGEYLTCLREWLAR
ncbi:MAG: glycosyltransferase family 4 protein [Planctomycetota bacterium]|nr:glycosyltransferase family 4 protein [Planctomycetota bacterium]